VVNLSLDQEKRLAQGHKAAKQPARLWKLDTFHGAGAIRSTARDMLAYLEAQLHPDSVKTLAPALKMSQELRADAMPGMKIALAWIFDTKTGSYWHSGATDGFSSYALFNPKSDYAIGVLFNTSENGSFANHRRSGRDCAPALV
jgi:serine-type D-Ala-D-Ala carboxypeptidase/endopeptidase